MPVITESDANEQAGFMVDDFWTDLNGNPFGSLAFDVGPGDTIYVDILALTADGQALAKAALAMWSAYTGINFQYGDYTSGVTENSIIFDDNQSGAFAGPDYLFTGNPTSTGADSTIYSSIVNVSTSWLSFYGTTIDSYSFQTYVHEIGHAMGLGHAGPYDGSATYGVDNIFEFDSWQMSIMSYFDQIDNTDITADFAYILTPMMADIVAMQMLYGTAGTLRTEDNTYTYDESSAGLFGADVAALIGNSDITNPIAMTILDDGGEDTFDFSVDTFNQDINLSAGGISSVYGITGNIIIFFSTVIENAMAGSGNDTVTGNDVANNLYGGAGDDEIFGGANNDDLYGGANNDDLYGGNGIDDIYGGTFNDAIYGGFGADNLYGGSGIDQLHGDDSNDDIFGGDGNDDIYGGANDDVLRGGGGADDFYGGTGTDTVSYDSSTSRLIMDLQNPTNGFGDGDGDTFDSIEFFEGSDWNDQLRGDSTSNDFSGGARTDRLYGRGGDDILDGEGGADAIYGNSGVDVMTGGDDTLRDRFIYFNLSESGVGTGNRDIITDFTSGEDRIEISRFDAQTDVGGNNAFSFIGSGQFSGTSGELRYQKYGSWTLVAADVDGDGVADWELRLEGVMDLTASDFLL